MAFDLGKVPWGDIAGNALTDLGYGLANSSNIGDAFGVAASQGAQQADARTKQIMEERKRLSAINQTVQWMKQRGYDDLAGAAEAGGDMNALWGEALKRSQPKDPLEINGQLVDPNTYKVIGDYRTQEAPKAPDMPASVEEYQYAKQQGYTGDFQTWKTDVARAGATNIDFNNSQSLAAGYADRMSESDKILNDPTAVQAMTDMGEGMKAGVPVAGNYLVSKEYQVAEQAKRDFINAILRRESGAAIAQSEFDNANRQYFPQPGDSPEVIAQKARNRQTAIMGVQRAAGPSYGAAQPGSGGVVDYTTYFGGQ